MKKTVSMSVKDFLKEHKRLIAILRNPTPEALEEEAKRQDAELKEYDLGGVKEIEDSEDDEESDESIADMPLNELKQKIQTISKD